MGTMVLNLEKVKCILFLTFFGDTGFELRVPHLLGRCSII
jgi:hypothetical protein